ncbi:MAG: proline hydroxylase [Gammaproteobacteria bacterium]|nr:proline hydroxylase [Gammaproteobacteria bacterium]
MPAPDQAAMREPRDWQAVEAELDAHGAAVLSGLLDSDDCAILRTLYGDAGLFRKRIVMQHKGYGAGEYQYFNYPLPPLMATLRETLYPPLAGIANRWGDALQLTARFPLTHAEYLAQCRAAGQRRPTPLLLRYGEGDYNCLHQDLYGEQIFPLQVAILLSRPEIDFTGGEFVLVEQRPRMQSRAEVVPLRLGDAVVFPVHHRPARSSRGFRRLMMRHGVSRLRSGERFTAGIIFHDAQ